MSDGDSDLVLEVLKTYQSEIDHLRRELSEVRTEFKALRGHLIANQTDVHNIYSVLNQHEKRMEGHDRRLALIEPPV